MSFLRPFWIALQLLTRLPVPYNEEPDAVAAGRSLLCYPLVGLLIGALLYGVAITLAGQLPVMLLAAIVLALWVIVTGALHLDGLADSADGWLGGYGDRERTLKIMHDPQSGPAAVVAVVLVLLLKFAALAAIVETHHGSTLLLVPMLARTGALLLFLTTPCARAEGMAASLAAQLPRKAAWGMVVLVVVMTAWLAPTTGLMGLAGLLLFLMLRRMMLARIGGMSGDTTGALIESIEMVALVVAAAGCAFC